MSAGRLLTKLPWGIAAVVLALGIVLRDCVLVSSSVLFLMHGFYSSMDRAQPWDSLRAALHCWVMSAGLFAVALGLLTWIAVAMEGARTPHNDNPVATIAVLGFIYCISVVLVTHYLAERIRANPAVTSMLQRIAGLFLIGFGVKLALSK